MKEILLNLIRERTNKILLAVELMTDKFGDLKSALSRRYDGEIAKSGFLDRAETVTYNFHGKGCHVQFGADAVNFDFDFESRHVNFDVWRIEEFLNYHRNEFPELTKLNEQDFEELLNELQRENKIQLVRHGGKCSKSDYVLTDSRTSETNADTVKAELILS